MTRRWYTSTSYIIIIYVIGEIAPIKIIFFES